MSLLRSVSTVSGFTLISRVLGFARDILMAAILGAGWVADAFFVAFKLPNFFRRLFAEGAFSAAFVPLVSSRMVAGDGADREAPEAAQMALADARRFAEEALSVLLLALLVVVALAELAMPVVMYGLAPGFVDEPQKYQLAIDLTRITFPYLLFISLVSLLAGVLNALGRFAAAAATPILLNLCLIGVLLILVPYTPTPAHALAWGVAGAGMVQFLWLIWACARAGVRLSLPRPRLTPGVRELLRLMAPGVVGAGAVQINLVIDIVLASLLPSGSLAYLFYADRLNQLPIGVVGVAVGTALLPLLARQVKAGARRDALASQNRAIEIALALTLPAAAALIVVPEVILRVLFERGAFTPDKTAATAMALAAYAAGLPAYVLVKVLGPGFFARKDMVTPVRFAIISLIVNTTLNLILMIPLKHVGLALATAIAAWVNVALMATTLARRGHLVMDARLRARLPRLILAAGLMAGLVWGLAASPLAPWLGGAEIPRIAALAALVVAGLFGYLAAAAALGALRPGELAAALRSGRPPE